MPAIPSGMRPLVTPYQIGSPGGVVETEVDGGAPRSALAYDRGTQVYNVALFLSQLGFAVWTTFLLHTVKKGSISFDMDLDSGYGVAEHQVTMVPGSYSAVPNGNIFRTVTFQVRAESQAYEMSAADAEALLDLYEEYGELSQMLLERIAVFATQDTLVLDF